MDGKAGALQEELRTLERRVMAARRNVGARYARRDVARALKESPYNVDVGEGGQRIGEWLGKKVPRDSDKVWALVRLWSEWAGERPKERYWRDLVDRAQPARSRASSASRLGWPIGELADPLALEVKQAIDVGWRRGTGDLPVLPPYLERAHDRRLRAATARAAGGRSTFVVLIGSSSTGKTRACWEALQALPPGWWLWHPITPSPAAAVVQGLPPVRPKTVLWLNGLQEYLRTPDGEQVATGLRELLRDRTRGPVLILGTLWREEHAELTLRPEHGRPDSHAQARALLEVATSLSVPTSFTAQELQQLGEVADHDSRLARAFKEAPAGRVVQFLAGVPEVRRRFQHAPDEARAVILAALDARRLGHGPKLNEMFLFEAASGHLDQDTWDRLGTDWFQAALDYAGEQCHGVPGPLTLIRPRPGEPSPEQPQYRLSDPLDQDARSERRYLAPPATLWKAAGRHAPVDDLQHLANAARSRGHFHHAMELSQRAADDGRYPGAVAFQAELLEQSGHEDQAVERLDELAAAGHPSGLVNMAQKWAAVGEWDDEKGIQVTRPYWGDAVQLTLRAAQYECPLAYAHLVQLYEQAGDEQAALTWERRLLDTDDAEAVLWAVGGTENRDRRERLGRQALVLGEPYAAMFLIDLHEGEGDRSKAEETARQAPRTGDFDARLYLAGKVLDEDSARAERLVRPLAADGSPEAMRIMAHLREAAGNFGEAEQWARQAAEAEDPDAFVILARLRELVGDGEGAETWALRAAEAHSTWALASLAERRGRRGNRAGVDRAIQLMVDGGYPSALTRLACLREQAGDRTRAEEFLRQAIEGGDPGACLELARLLGVVFKVSRPHQERCEGDGCLVGLGGLVVPGG
ncbi:hypothetical protein ACH4XT_34425, partial [Streptomyces avidinii]|uniref:hypothetical protein n=1 Tax=Streptomyces avidinii TaxID=1895 RepID=UPI00378F7A90